MGEKTVESGGVVIKGGLSPAEHERRLELYNKGLSDAAISAAVNRSVEGIIGWRKKNKLPSQKLKQTLGEQAAMELLAREALNLPLSVASASKPAPQPKAKTYRERAAQGLATQRLAAAQEFASNTKLFDPLTENELFDEEAIDERIAELKRGKAKPWHEEQQIWRTSEEFLDVYFDGWRENAKRWPAREEAPVANEVTLRREAKEQEARDKARARMTAKREGLEQTVIGRRTQRF